MKENPTALLDFRIPDEAYEMLGLLREVCEKEIVPRRAEMDAKEIFPTEIFQKFAQAGLFAFMFSEKYGGYDLGGMLTVLGIEIVSEYCLGVATSLGAVKLGALPIEHGGTEEQKMQWLPKFAAGEKIAAFALTEPNAGSDVPNLSTVAVKKGDRYILNGTKQWITNAGQADVYTIFALTDKTKGPRGMSCFIVEKGTKGLSFGKLEDKMGIRCSHTRQVILEDCEVPEENLVGLKPNQGFIHALKTLNSSRPFIAAMAVGLAQGAYREALKYTRQREQFGRNIINFQVVQHMLADMVVKIEAARLLAYRAAKYSMENHPETAKYSAIAKYYASEIAVQVCNDALQLHGGYGFTKDYPVEKMYRDSKILTIYEGTSQIQKNEIGAYCIKEASKLV
ncbi:MAG: acyl-CoA dehydrogenase family protein [Leptospiraceae bacterium]|nr:acyl-CoA dehydrogenase family protein [Leptospiraceae bacterium]MDW8307076.1 acyl-CoA dehydrogenase family protein [Leptospiraceae bacterium]